MPLEDYVVALTHLLLHQSATPMTNNVRVFVHTVMLLYHPFAFRVRALIYIDRHYNA
jgi:hypothetical protein